MSERFGSIPPKEEERCTGQYQLNGGPCRVVCGSELSSPRSIFHTTPLKPPAKVAQSKDSLSKRKRRQLQRKALGGFSVGYVCVCVGGWVIGGCLSVCLLVSLGLSLRLSLSSSLRGVRVCIWSV